MDERTRWYLELCEADIEAVCPNTRPLRLQEGDQETDVNTDVSPALRAAYEAHIRATPGASEVLCSPAAFAALSLVLKEKF